jgi:hypothetical protein
MVTRKAIWRASFRDVLRDLATERALSRLCTAGTMTQAQIAAFGSATDHGFRLGSQVAAPASRG